MEMGNELNLSCSGPYSWPDFEPTNGLPALPAFGGVYLQTAEYGGGYLIYCAGVTGRPFRERFIEHKRCYMAGEYTVLDITALQQGRRAEIWHGWGYARAHRAEFAARQAEIRAAANQQMAGFRLFVAPVDDRRNRDRLYQRSRLVEWFRSARRARLICGVDTGEAGRPAPSVNMANGGES